MPPGAVEASTTQTAQRAATARVIASPSSQSALHATESPNDETAPCPELLAAVQHELWLPRHPVRVGSPAGEHVGPIREARRASRSSPLALVGCASHGLDRTTHRRRVERPHVGAAW